MRWREPLRPEGRLWLDQFNEAFAALTLSGFGDNVLASQSLRALRSLLEREPECADMVAGLLGNILFQGRDLLPLERVLEAAELGFQAERLRTDASPERVLQRCLFETARGENSLARNEPFRAVDDAIHASALLDAHDGQLVEHLRAAAALLEGEAWDALLEPGRASGPYERADAAARWFMEEEQQLGALVVQVASFLYGDAKRIPEEAVRATLQIVWRNVALVRVQSAVGTARVRALLGSPGLAETTRDAAVAIGKLGPGPVDALALVPIVRRIDATTTQSLVNAVVEQARNLELDAETFVALLSAVGATKVAEDGADPTELLRTARAATRSVNDAVLAAATLGWAAVAEAKSVGSRSKARPRGPHMRELERLEGALDPRLRDLRVRATFDEPLSHALDEASAVDRLGTETRVSLARLLDGLGTVKPFDALLIGTDGLEAIDGSAHAFDRLGRLESALRTWPEAAVVVERQLPSETLFVCVSARTSTFLARAGPPWREAARMLSSRLEDEIAALELVGTSGPQSVFEAAGRVAYEALPQRVRALLSEHEVVLLCPDYRANGDSVPYELLHDGSGWLGLTAVLARFPSLGALVRAVEGASRRNLTRRALAVAVPHAEGFNDLRFAAVEAEWVHGRLMAEGWDAPEISSNRVTSAFVLDRLPFVGHVHFAAHGDATGHDEAIILVDGERLHTDDLLKRFFPRMPTVYLNTCSLAATRYVGAGVSRGVALALAERGAPAVVANLLPVDDSLSSKIATAFYENGDRFGKALRAARSSVAATGASPLFWGTTILIGDPRTTVSPTASPATTSQRLLDGYFLKPDDVDAEAVLSASLARLQDERDPRSLAATALLREVASWKPRAKSRQRPRMGAALQLALELDHLPSAALIAFRITETMDDGAEHDLALRAVEEALALVEPMESEGGLWQRLLDALLARWEQLRRGDRRIEPRVTGGEQLRQKEALHIGTAIMNIDLAQSARAARGGYAVEPRDERVPADVCWNAVVARRELGIDDMPGTFRFARQVVRRLIGVDGLSQASTPVADTAVAGLIQWLWDRQHATDLPLEVAEGQARTLGQLVESLGSHWPPAPASWLDSARAFPKETVASLATLEGLPYDDRLYPRIDEVMQGISSLAWASVKRVRAEHPDRVPDATAWILGTLVEHNTYSWMDGSVPEDLSDRLLGIFAEIGRKGDELFFPWLMKGFKSVRERDVDELARWRYGVGLPRDQMPAAPETGEEEPQESDNERLEDRTGSGGLRDGSGPSVSRTEREARIRTLLESRAEDTIDNLPEGLLALVEDDTYLPLLEEKLDPRWPTVVLSNAVQAIGLLADWEWDHREVRSPDTSIPKLVELYRRTRGRTVRGQIIQTLFKFDPADVPLKFLIDRLGRDHVRLKAQILAELQFVVQQRDLEDLVMERLLPMLHRLAQYPLSKSLYEDEFSGEMDLRFWVFRCIRMIGSDRSVPVVEAFLEANEEPLETLVEAAHAHWALTHTPVYLAVLREAKRQGALGNAEDALKEIERFIKTQSRE